MIGTLRVLLIEDDFVDAKNFERVLGKTDIESTFKHLTSTEEGFNELKENDYDLVFLDYHLPKGNGLTLLKSLNEIGFTVPVVIITSYADPHVAVEMIQSGASDYIPKSLLNVDGLSQCIRNSVKVKELEKKKKETEKQLRKVEDRLGTIISNTPIILFVLDRNGDFQLGIGKHWESFNPSTNSVIGVNFLDVFEEYNILTKAVQSCYEGSIQKCTIEINEIVFEITLTPTLDDDQEVREVLGLALDISDHANGKESLRKAKQIAENTSKLKQEFIANMSHEIRTPMNAIIGFTNLICETELSVLQTEFVKAIKVSGENLLTLVNDVLDFSKIEAGKLTLEKEDFLLHDVIESVCRILEVKASENRIKLQFNINGNVPKAIKGDPTRLYQILMNLTGNALKFTQKGSIYIDVSIKKEGLNDVVLCFQVKDTGVGIPVEKQQMIFESFMQVEGKSNRRKGGTGLGLSIVKNLIDLMDGDISVQSEVNKGSVFTFNVPFGFADSDFKIQKEVVDLKEKFKKLEGKRILLAEDNAMNQKLVIMYLKKYNVSIDLAETGIQAVKAVRSNDYDLVLMDIQMPDMDGVEATSEIRNTIDGARGNVPILAMTAHAFKEEIDKCFNVGMNAHISKPIDKQEFLTLISSLVFTKEKKTENKGKSVSVQKKNINQVDLSYLRDMAEGNEGFVMEMIKIFKDDSPDLIQKMRNAFDQSDWAQLSKLAHKYRSPAVMMGMKNVAKIAEEIEYNNYESGNLQEINQLLIKIEEQSSEAINYIETNF